MQVKEMPGQPSPRTTDILFTFRFPVKQIGQSEIVVQVPRGSGVPIFTTEFMRTFDLSDSEIDHAEYETLKAIALKQ